MMYSVWGGVIVWLFDIRKTENITSRKAHATVANYVKHVLELETLAYLSFIASYI
jgi:hypothetical protein